MTISDGALEILFSTPAPSGIVMLDTSSRGDEEKYL
jgi:hypothetical protein